MLIVWWLGVIINRLHTSKVSSTSIHPSFMDLRSSIDHQLDIIQICRFFRMAIVLNQNNNLKVAVDRKNGQVFLTGGGRGGSRGQTDGFSQNDGKGRQNRSKSRTPSRSPGRSGPKPQVRRPTFGHTPSELNRLRRATLSLLCLPQRPWRFGTFRKVRQIVSTLLKLVLCSNHVP